MIHLGSVDIHGGEMWCLDCQQTRDTSFIPVSLISHEQKQVEAHTIRVCALCCSTDLKISEPDTSRKIESSFRW